VRAKKIFLVTGAAGFIGSNLIYDLEKIVGVEIVAIVKDTSKSWRLKNVSSKTKIIECDLTKFKQVRKLINKYRPQYIIHLATEGIYTYQWSDPARVLTNNYSMCVNLLEASKEYSNHIKGLVMIGTVHEYGSVLGSMKENMESNADLANQYAVSKRATTILGNSYKETIPIVTLRLVTVYGPYNDYSKFLEGTINKIIEGNPVKINNNVIKDFVYVKDVTKAIIIAALNAGKLRGETINIGSGYGYELEDILKYIQNKISESSSYSYLTRFDKCSGIVKPMNWACIDKAKKWLNWQPQYSFEEGIALTIDWYIKYKHVIPKVIIDTNF
jgi:nucleoside-diphosphate-sugar epimerase